MTLKENYRAPHIKSVLERLRLREQHGLHCRVRNVLETKTHHKAHFSDGNQEARQQAERSE